jgi:hypothetical protein
MPARETTFCTHGTRIHSNSGLWGTWGTPAMGICKMFPLHSQG